MPEVLPSIRLRCPHWLIVTNCLALACGTPLEPAPKATPPIAHSVDTRPNSAIAAQPANRVVAAPPQTQEQTPPSPTPVPAWDPGLANLNPDDDYVIGPPDEIPDCEARLKAAGVTFRVAKLPLKQQHGFVCGSPQVVEYLDGPEHIRFRPRPIVTCQLALGLAHLEHVLNRTATELLGKKVVSVTQGGTYSCRSMARFKAVSEHSYANAIDLYAFGLSDARTAKVVTHFGDPRHDATTPEGRFLRTLAQRLFDEQVFSVVVTRYFDELHRDHIHVDMAHYRTDGSR